VAIAEAYDGDDGAVNRRLRLLVGAVVALVVAGALVAPVVLSTGGGGSCSTTLYYLGRPYVVRAVGRASIVQDVAIGVGVTRGCGNKPENVNVRSLAGVRSAAAIALEGLPSVVYVRRGVCPDSTGSALWACLTR
jgi:hypothetical protein